MLLLPGPVAMILMISHFPWWQCEARSNQAASYQASQPAHQSTGGSKKLVSRSVSKLVSGCVGKLVSKWTTSLATRYPIGLCSEWVDIMRSCAPAQALKPPGQAAVHPDCQISLMACTGSSGNLLFQPTCPANFKCPWAGAVKVWCHPHHRRGQKESDVMKKSSRKLAEVMRMPSRKLAKTWKRRTCK